MSTWWGAQSCRAWWEPSVLWGVLSKESLWKVPIQENCRREEFGKKKLEKKPYRDKNGIRLVLYLDHLVKRPLLVGYFYLIVFLWFAWVLILFSYNLPYENHQDSRVDLILSSLFYTVFIEFCLLFPLGLPLHLTHGHVINSYNISEHRGASIIGVSEAPAITFWQKDFESCICFLLLLCNQTWSNFREEVRSIVVEKAWRPGKLSVHGNTSMRLFLLILVGQAGKQQARAGHL